MEEQKLSKNSTPLVSIILPVYNAGKYLRPCLYTLVNQTLRDIEIICVLDCPTDGSDKVVEEYAADDKRIVIIRNERNLHIGESRNVGIRAARGEYIGFSDHDDTHELDMYEKLYIATDAGSKNVVLSGRFVIDNFSNKSITDIREECIINILHRNSTGHITPHLFKKDFLREYGLFFIDTKLCFGEDIVFFLNAIGKTQSSKDISLVFKCYYKHNITGFNTANSSQYYSIDKVPVFINYINSIVNEIEHTEVISRSVLIILVKISYTLFLDFTHKVGISSAIQQLQHTILSDKLCKEIIHNNPLTIKSLSLMKVIYAIWLKWDCR